MPFYSYVLNFYISIPDILSYILNPKVPSKVKCNYLLYEGFAFKPNILGSLKILIVFSIKEQKHVGNQIREHYLSFFF